MSNQDCITLEESLATIACLQASERSLERTMRQLRLARVKLGAAIEHLERHGSSYSHLEQLIYHAESIAGEIDALKALIDF